MTPADTIATWTEVVVRTLLADGYDAHALLREVGIDPRRLGDANCRIPLERMSRLWRGVRRLTGDEGYGLRVAEHCRPTDIHGLAFALQSSVTLGEELQRIVRFSPIVSTSSEALLLRGRHSTTLSYRNLPGVQVEQMATEALIAAGLRFSRRAGFQDRHSCVYLARPRPADSARWEAAFGARIVFQQPHNAVEYPNDLLDLPVSGGNSELTRGLDEAMDAYLRRLQRQNLPARVMRAIASELASGEVQQSEVAGALGMSVRNLHRHLLKHDTSFKALLDDTRKQRAFDYLRQSHIPVNEIGYRLGFLEPSSFNRAFRRWTGQSPGQWRQAQPDAARLPPGPPLASELSRWSLAV